MQEHCFHVQNDAVIYRCGIVYFMSKYNNEGQLLRILYLCFGNGFLLFAISFYLCCNLIYIHVTIQLVAYWIWERRSTYIVGTLFILYNVGIFYSLTQCCYKVTKDNGPKSIANYLWQDIAVKNTKTYKKTHTKE